jgi:hypothetical protein
LAFWYGVLRLCTFTVQMGGGFLFGQGMAWRWIGADGIGQAVVGLMFMATTVAGGVLAIIGGRGVQAARPAALRLLMWGAVLLGASGTLQTVQSLLQVFGRGTGQPAGFAAYYLLQSVFGMAAYLLWPIFIVYFVSRPELREAKH